MDETERANLIAQIALSTDILLTAPPAPAPATRFVKRGFYMCCVTCGLTIDYCKGHAAPAASAAQDGADAASLARRVKDCAGSR
jgi:hypothetical protein